MARYVTTVESTRSREDAFAYLSDFSNALEWDPGVVGAERAGQRRGDGRQRVPARDRVHGSPGPPTYRVIELEAPRRVTFLAETGTLTSLDTIPTFEQRGEGSSVTYDADLRLKGPLKLADPLLRLAFKSIGDKARDGLRTHLGG